MSVLDWKKNGGFLLASFETVQSLSGDPDVEDPMWTAMREADVMIVDEGQEMARLPLARSIKRLAVGIKRRVVLTGVALQDCFQVIAEWFSGW